MARARGEKTPGRATGTARRLGLRGRKEREEQSGDGTRDGTARGRKPLGVKYWDSFIEGIDEKSDG